MCGYTTTIFLCSQGLYFVNLSIFHGSNTIIYPFSRFQHNKNPSLYAFTAAERGFSFGDLWRAAGRASCPGGGRQQGSTGAAPQHVPKQCGGRPSTSPRIGTLSFVTQNLLWCDQQQWEFTFPFVATSDWVITRISDNAQNPLYHSPAVMLPRCYK